MANGTHASHGLRHTWRGRRNTPARRARSASASCFLARPTRGVRPPPTHALTIAMPAPRQFFAAHITATAFVLHRFLRSLVWHGRLRNTVCGSSRLCVFVSRRLCAARFIRLACRRLPPTRSRENCATLTNPVGTNFPLRDHAFSPFSSSTATPVLERYVPYVLPLRPCLRCWGDHNPGRADPWAVRIRHSILC